VQLICKGDYPRSLKGIRADCALRLCHGESLIAQSAGELQFTDNGVSGPAVFDISREAAAGGEGLSLHADFLREYGEDAVLTMLKSKAEAYPELEASELFTGILHNRLGRMLAKYCGIAANSSIGSLSPRQLSDAVRACKDFTLDISGTEGFDHAQVTAGGIKTTGFNPETLESWFMPGLFVCGELLDVDGDCGGYNLQWAWASGYVAGRLGK